ncbi:MAG TPA: DUF2281 domain-containing protein [Gallionellaceae bacterium]|nr:DUF2281 domain-containing protein [Gallionellaceae bacterium]
MTLAETIYQHSLNLPEPAAREALDFIQFLEQRYRSKESPEDQSDEARRSAALAYFANVRLHFEGKPIPNRDALYDSARD